MQDFILWAGAPTDGGALAALTAVDSAIVQDGMGTPRLVAVSTRSAKNKDAQITGKSPAFLPNPIDIPALDTASGDYIPYLNLPGCELLPNDTIVVRGRNTA